MHARSSCTGFARLRAASERMNKEQYWDRIYRTKAPSEVSWYQPEARLSLQLIRCVAPQLNVPVLDVGGGASTLVDGLLASGYSDVTVMDLAGAALVRAQDRLGERAARRVRWIVDDVLEGRLPGASCAVWHDRAVFHFLTDAHDRARYVAQAQRVVRPGGHVIIASFGPQGPARCSGLEVVRYSPDDLHSEFGSAFQLLESTKEDHRTPAGKVQPFVYCLCRVEAGLRKEWS
jgi:ubiquinone/menaquinone biosynthesis C-methylase UbiE